MKVTETSLAEVLVIVPDVFGDDRGYFLETWSARRYQELGIPSQFVQDNLSWSRRGVLRGLHLQHPNGQGKLISVALGAVFDVAVDVRIGSPTFGRWTGRELSEANHCQVYIPPGFAHGFVVLSEVALFTYKCTAPHVPESELGIAYDDPDIGIDWPISDPLLSPRDRSSPKLSEIARSRLPGYPG